MNPNLKDDSKATQFKKGQSGNPGGKPIGARNRLNAAFLTALAEQFEQSGADAIKTVATEQPDVFVRVLAGLLPKELEISKPHAALTDDELVAAISALKDAISAQGVGAGTGESAGAKQATELPTLQ